MLEFTKLRFQGFVGTKHAFVEQEAGTTEARECLEEVRAQFLADGVQLEDGT